jgi:hypothetical protein
MVKNPLKDLGGAVCNSSQGPILRSEGTARGGSFSLWFPSKLRAPDGDYSVRANQLRLPVALPLYASYHRATIGTGAHGASLG